jgi:hypothetical protein
MNLKLRLAKKHADCVHDGAVWKVLDDEKEEGPYCLICHEKTNHFIQPSRGALNNGMVAFSCGKHGKSEFVFRVPVTMCGEAPSDEPKPRSGPLYRA